MEDARATPAAPGDESTSESGGESFLATQSFAQNEGNNGTPHQHDDTHHPQRDPFWAFVPQVLRFGAGVAISEVRTVESAVRRFPSWSVQYANDTYSFYRYNPKILYKEIISGFTVAIMQVPESIAFSFVAGVPPLSGLHATFWMATITGLFGGKPGMISGAAGALAVVVADMTQDNGVLDYLTVDERLNVLYMTMFVCGLFQIAFAALRLAKLVRLIPETGMIGFMNGLAIIIFMAQLPAFQTCPEYDLFVDCQIDQRQWLTFQDDTWQLLLTFLHVGICMAIMKLFPLVPKIGKIVPASLVGLLVGTLLEHALFRPVFDVATRTVEETAEMSGSLPKFDWPSIPGDSETFKQVMIYGVTLAAIGSVESVLTLQACNEITDTVPKIADSNQELFAQGLANLVSGLFRAMGGDAMIGQSTINIMNGARYRVSSTSSGIFMLLFVIALSGFIEMLPVATLTGVLFMVVLSTFQWKTFMILRYGRLTDSAAILLVTLIAVFFNLAIAIAVGIVFSALVHAWDSGKHVKADVELHKRMIINGLECDEVKYVKIRGAIFFSSARNFVNLFDVAADPDTIVIDLKDAVIIDHSAVAAIQGVTHRFDKVGKRVLLVNLPTKCHGRLHRTHGDHDMLRRQITAASDVRKSEISSGDEESSPTTSASVGETTAASASEQPGDETGLSPHTAPPQRIDEVTIGETLNHLHMFDVPVDSVDHEMEVLLEEQGKVSIREHAHAE